MDNNIKSEDFPIHSSQVNHGKKSYNILVIDDEKDVRETICEIVRDEGHHTQGATDWDSAHVALSSEPWDIVLLDVWMPKLSGTEVLSKMKEQFPGVVVIMISGHASIDLAVDCIRDGAFDFIEKPLSIDRILTSIQKAFRFYEMKNENNALRGIIARPYKMIGNAPGIKKIRTLINNVAKTSSTVLITGENGTGKDLVAQSLHIQSSRAFGPFVAINCAAISTNLVESELFGHEKGAFTGAHNRQKGKFEQANDGCIFLDEVAELPLETQVKLLRVLESRSITPVGGSAETPVNVRIIAATNRDVEKEVEEGRLREDLFYRLNVVRIHVPPLRERRDDIPMLAQHFFQLISEKDGIPLKTLSENAQVVLSTEHDWPGNIRELRNTLERLAILVSSDEVLSPEDVREHFPKIYKVPENTIGHNRPNIKNMPLKVARDLFERDYIREILIENSMNVSHTATALGIERSHLHRKIRQLKLDSQKK